MLPTYTPDEALCDFPRLAYESIRQWLQRVLRQIEGVGDMLVYWEVDRFHDSVILDTERERPHNIDARRSLRIPSPMQVDNPLVGCGKREGLRPEARRVMLQ